MPALEIHTEFPPSRYFNSIPIKNAVSGLRTYYSIMPKLQRWTGKGTAYKIWKDVNTYVESYTSEHPHELQSSWFQKWYKFYHESKIGDETISVQVAALVISGNPHASIYDCVQILFHLIPDLKQHLIVQEIGKHNGNIRYYLNEYGFCTPTRTASPVLPVQPVSTSNADVVTCNCYELLQDNKNDEEFDHETSLRSRTEELQSLSLNSRSHNDVNAKLTMKNDASASHSSVPSPTSLSRHDKVKTSSVETKKRV